MPSFWKAWWPLLIKFAGDCPLKNILISFTTDDCTYQEKQPKQVSFDNG
jgi:hypothetical protein